MSKQKLLGHVKCPACEEATEVRGELDAFNRVDVKCAHCKTEFGANLKPQFGEDTMAAKKAATKKAAPKKTAKPKAAPAKNDAPKAPRASTVYTKKGNNKTWAEHRSVLAAFQALDLPIGVHQAFRKELKAAGELPFADSGYTFRTVAHHTK